MILKACSPFACLVQATSKKQHIAFEGYCCLPEMQDKQWYWTEKGHQQGPYGIADLFNMSQGG